MCQCDYITHHGYYAYGHGQFLYSSPNDTLPHHIVGVQQANCIQSDYVIEQNFQSILFRYNLLAETQAHVPKLTDPGDAPPQATQQA